MSSRTQSTPGLSLHPAVVDPAEDAVDTDGGDTVEVGLVATDVEGLVLAAVDAGEVDLQIPQ